MDDVVRSAIVSLVWFFASVIPINAVAAPPKNSKPNIVFILADDLGWGEIGCYGQTKIPTPHIDRLAKEGIRFTQHYSGAPVCAPSRCVLMTGRHLGHAEIRNNRQASQSFPQFESGQHPLSESAITIAQVLRNAGYTTGAMGKWGLGPVGSSGDPNKKGFDLFFGYNCQAVAHSYYPPFLWRNDAKVAINKQPVPGHTKPVDGDVRIDDYLGECYSPTRMIAEAESFIADNADRPFFLYLPFIEPHVAMHPPRESLDRFPTDWDSKVYRGQCGYLPHPRPRAAYAAMISDLDTYVGRIRDALDEYNILDRTMIVFTSDNGTTHPRRQDTHFHVGGVDAQFFKSTAGLRGYKGSLYEGGIRVPMIVRYSPHVPAAVVSDFPCYFADWFPTLCEAAGVESPPGLDGQSLWPQLIGKSDEHPRKPMVWVFPAYGGQVAVRMGSWKAIRQQLSTKNPEPWQLYRIDSDPAETQDMADQNPAKIREATDILRRQIGNNDVFSLSIPGVTSAREDDGASK